MNVSFKLIPMVDAADFPREVEDWCVNNDVPTHYDSGIACVEVGKPNPLLDWLIAKGFKPTGKYQYIAIRGT